MWTRDPQIRAIFSSYSEDLAIRDSLRCRSVVSSEQYRRLFRPTWRLAIDQNEKNWFENDKKGVRMALSVGGKGTGFRADHLVVDDPLNARDQHSRSALEEVINWFDQAMSSRLNDPAHGGIVIIMQRLSELDLAAHVLRRDGYVHLNLTIRTSAGKLIPLPVEYSRRAATPRRFASVNCFPERPATFSEGSGSRLQETTDKSRRENHCEIADGPPTSAGERTDDDFPG